MQIIGKQVWFLAAFFWGAVGFGQTVEFHIKAGTQKADWNTKDALVTVHVGDTIKFVNHDSISHALHTEDDIPFKHTKAIKPNGGSLSVNVLAAYDSEKSGPLHDHESEANFWINAVTVEEVVSFSKVLSTYSLIHNALVIDEVDASKAAAKNLNELSAKWLSENPSGVQTKNITAIAAGTEEIQTAEDIDAVRIAFIKVSDAAIELIRADAQLKLDWQLFFCPMVAKNRGFWVQPKAEKLANPYMGSAMPACGSKKPW